MPRYSIMFPVRETYVFGHKINFECEPGFLLEGAASLKCVEMTDGVIVGPGGTWDQEPPTCKGIIMYMWYLVKFFYIIIF